MRYLFIFLVLLALQGQAATYYFSTSTGDDTRSSATAQNKSTPWKTTSKLASLADNDVAKFKAGESFPGAFTIAKKITMDSFGTGARPIITGMYKVTTWTPVSGMPGVYESEAITTSITTNMVVINGASYAMGRYPNAKATNGGYLNYESYSKSVTSNPDTITDNTHQAGITTNFVGGQVVIRYTHFQVAKATITSITGTSNTVIGYTGITPNATPANGYGYFIQNNINTLDQFGEWYFNPTTKKLSVYFGSKVPSNYSVQVVNTDYLVTIHANNVTINNMALYGGNYIVNSNWTLSGFVLHGCEVSYAGFTLVTFANMSNSTYTNNSFNWANSCGIDMYYQDQAMNVLYNSFHNIGIYNGMLERDLGGYFATAIMIGDTDSTYITGNDIHQAGYIGVRLNQANYVYVMNNLVDTFETAVDDAGAFYTWAARNSTGMHDRYFIDNFATHGQGASEGTSDGTDWGGAYYTDDNTQDVVFQGNTAANNSYRGMFIHHSKNITVRDNIFYNNQVAQLHMQYDGQQEVTGCIVKGNKFFGMDNSTFVILLKSSIDDFTQMGVFDSNYYCRPLKETGIIERDLAGTSPKLYDIVSTSGSSTDWKTYISGDNHSVKTPIAVTSTKQVVFAAAPSNSTNNVIYCKPVTSLGGQTIKGSNPVLPYKSDIMLSSTNILP